MNREDARQRVKQDFVQAFELFGDGEDEMEPEDIRKMVDNVVDQYEGYVDGAVRQPTEEI